MNQGPIQFYKQSKKYIHYVGYDCMGATADLNLEEKTSYRIVKKEKRLAINIIYK